MIVRSFKSVIWVGAVAGAALSCYMVSLRVASERASLESVESRILMAKRDIRSLDTELTTRGRIRQLERWNTDVLALAAPTEAQFLENEVQLASLTRVEPVTPEPSVMLASSEEVSKPQAVVLATYRPDDVKPPVRLVLASMPMVAPPKAVVVRPKPVKVADAEVKPAPKSTSIAKIKIATLLSEKAKPAPSAVRSAGASKARPKPVRMADAEAKAAAKPKVVPKMKVAALASEKTEPVPPRERLVDAGKPKPARAKAAAAKPKPVRVAAAEAKTAAKPKAVPKIKVAVLASEKAKPGNRR